MVEHAAVNRVVVGSSPTSGANLVILNQLLGLASLPNPFKNRCKSNIPKNFAKYFGKSANPAGFRFKSPQNCQGGNQSLNDSVRADGKNYSDKLK